MQDLSALFYLLCLQDCGDYHKKLVKIFPMGLVATLEY